MKDLNSPNNQVINNEGEISFEEILKRFTGLGKFIKGQFWLILIFCFLGGLLGLVYSFIKKPIYTAVYTFVLEEEGKGGLGQYASLASLAGIDIGSGGGGIFQGDNILELYKSRKMIEKSLLSEAYFNGKKQKLIDRYIDIYKLRKDWEKEKELKGINFEGDPNHFNRHQDSLITDLVILFNKKVLTVVKPEKKLSIIMVTVSTEDELLSKEFANSIVENVNSFYIQTKTKKLSQNVDILRKQSDSVRSILNNSLSGVAIASDISPNANPILATLRVSAQRKQVDVQASSAIYAELVKNLELSKIQLRKEVPLIQSIDKPVIPLAVDKLGKIKGSLFGILFGLILGFGWIFYSFFRR